MKKISVHLPVIFSMLLLSSCYPGEPKYADELDIAITYYDPETNFQDFKTIALPDSIVIISNNPAKEKLTHQLDRKILAFVKANLTNCGYAILDTTTIKNGTTPDLIITISAFSDPTYYYQNSYSWYKTWQWYSGWNTANWYLPDTQPAYPWPPPNDASYMTSTIAIEMFVPSKTDRQTQRIPVIWTGLFNGVWAGSSGYISQRLEKTINRCFAQSPYLIKTIQ